MLLLWPLHGLNREVSCCMKPWITLCWYVFVKWFLTRAVFQMQRSGFLLLSTSYLGFQEHTFYGTDHYTVHLGWWFFLLLFPSKRSDKKWKSDNERAKITFDDQSCPLISKAMKIDALFLIYMLFDLASILYYRTESAMKFGWFFLMYMVSRLHYSEMVFHLLVNTR